MNALSCTATSPTSVTCSLVIHPASANTIQPSPAEQLATGVSLGLVRLAVGIEGIDDILVDLEPVFVGWPADSAPPSSPWRRL